MPANRGALHFAAGIGDAKEVARLLNQGCDVHERDYDRRTPLHVAAANGQLSVLEMLCSKGADLSLVDRWGRTALADAINGNHSDSVTFLTQRGMASSPRMAMMLKQVSFKQMNPNSPLLQLLNASAEGDIGTVTRLLDAKQVGVDDCDDDRRTAAHLAASEGRIDILRLLISRGANVNAKDRLGNRPMNDAQREGHFQVVNFLHSNGAILSPSNQADTEPQHQMTVRHVSKDALNELHRRGVREFWSWDKSDFVLEKDPFAHGTGGEVYKCRFRNMDCVAKTLGKLQSRQNLTDLSNEISLMASIRHPNIVTFFGACFQMNEPIMLLEFCGGGNLESRIIRGYTQDSSRRVKLTDSQKIKYSHQMAIAMTFLHQFHIPIIHRDLKPGNVLLTANDDIKITDFGLAKFRAPEQKESEGYKMTGETGSYRFMAPEVYEHRDYDLKVDVYAYTMIIFWLFAGSRPFSEFKDGLDAVKAACKQQRPDLKLIREVQVAELIDFGWSHEPARRPTFADIADRFEELKFTGLSRGRSRSRIPSRSASIGGGLFGSKLGDSTTRTQRKGNASGSEEEKKSEESESLKPLQPVQKRKSLLQRVFS